jgi:GDP-mannose 6-dehydrogenase
VVVRSTALPGTTRTLLVPVIESASGRALGDGWGVCYHPEFLREGSSVRDFSAPSLSVAGASDRVSADLLASLYTTAPVRCSVEEAEMVKYAANAWHGMKVAFANEIGAVSRATGLDGRRVMDLFCLDRQLNLSEAYLRPAFAFGGSCLPKDIRGLTAEAHRLGLDLPLLAAVLRSNARHIDRALQLIARTGAGRIGLAGLSFKPGTDDLRESPLVELAVRLIHQGVQLRVYDPRVDPTRLAGANQEYLESRLPGASLVMVDSLGELVKDAGLVVIGHLDSSRRETLGGLLGERAVVDLEGFFQDGRAAGDYQGICW